MIQFELAKKNAELLANEKAGVAMTPADTSQ